MAIIDKWVLEYPSTSGTETTYVGGDGKGLKIRLSMKLSPLIGLGVFASKNEYDSFQIDGGPEQILSDKITTKVFGLGIQLGF